MTTETTPGTLNSDEVLIRVHATSVNYRDNTILAGQYPLPPVERGVPLQDSAAEIVDVGSAVKEFKVGDRVSVLPELNYMINEGETDFHALVALGANHDGVLRQYAVFKEAHLVHIPQHLSWEEGAAIPCVGITAWSALNMPESIGKAKAALLEGTGGVSMFGLALCLAAGIRPIITSSSDAKLEKIRKLAGLDGDIIGTINYRTTPDLVAEVKRLTDGRGVDLVVGNAGPSTWTQGLQCLAYSGTLSVVGMTGGTSGNVDVDMVMQLIAKKSRIQGIIGATKSQFVRLNDFLAQEKVKLKMIIDCAFDFDYAQEALEYLKTGQHIGKIIIKVQERAVTAQPPQYEE